MGLDQVPSTASLAPIFRQAGVARLEPKKKPRGAWRRFVYPAPNACWQLDATEYVLTGGRKCVIFQLIDDHSQFALASHVARSETAKAAITVFGKAVAAHGVPQRLLSDNGIALNPSRRGYLGQFVEHLSTLGVQAITGKPYKPTTQGKNERSIRPCSVTSTSSHWQAHSPKSKPKSTHSITSTTPNDLTKDYPCESPRAQHGKPPPKAEAPRPQPDPPFVVKRHQNALLPIDLPAGTHLKTLGSNGTFSLAGATYKVAGRYAFEQVVVTTDVDTIIVANLVGEVLIEHTRSAPGVRYVGNGKPTGLQPKAR